MRTKSAYALLMSAALIASPVFAQNSPPPATNVAPVTTPAGPAGSTMGTNPNATAGSATNMSANTTSGSNNFMTRREPGMFRASELIGKDVRGANNEDIGEIGDVLIDRNGQVRAVIVDIGGFLGIGESHVAVPMQSLQFRSNQQNAGATGASNNSALPNTTGATGPANQNQANRPTNTQNQGSNQSAASTQAAGANQGAPDLIVLVMTKEQLQSAPKFEDDNRAGRDTNASGTNNNRTGSGTAPRQ